MDNAQLNTYNMMEDQVDVAARKRVCNYLPFHPIDSFIALLKILAGIFSVQAHE